MKMRNKMGMILVFLLLAVMLFAGERQIIQLSWDDIAERCRLDNISLQMSSLDKENQSYQVKKAWGSFLPVLEYQWVWSDDESDDAQLAMIYPAGQVPENLFIHSLQLTYPLFTGGARYAGLKMQQHLKKSLAAEFRGKEAGVVYEALQAYYGVILAEAMVGVYAEAENLAETNLRQVESYFRQGTATELAVKQARTRLFESIPQHSNARNQYQLAEKNLKYILNIEAGDSLVINDILEERQFLGEYSSINLSEARAMAKRNRTEIEQIKQQGKVADDQKLLAVSQFLPVVALTASAQQVTYSQDWSVEAEEFERYNSIGLAVQLPLFQGGSRYYDLQMARTSQKKMRLLQEQVTTQIELDAENAYYNWHQAESNLQALREALLTAEESLRLANAYFEQGMINQTEVLGAQLAFIQNEIAFQNGIFQYNTSQLALLKAIGELHSIWQNE